MTDYNQETTEFSYKEIIHMLDSVESKEKDDFVDSGFKTFDETFGGWKENAVTVLSYRPGMGSFVLMMNSAIEKAKANEKVLFISRESTFDNFYRRVMAKLTKTPVQKINQPQTWTSDELLNMKLMYKDTFSSINDNLRFVDAFNLSEMKSVMKLNKIHHGTNTVFIDHGELTSDMLKELIDFARQEKLTIVVNHTLDRTIESREEKRPKFQDLNDLFLYRYDVNFFGLYRDEVYNPDTNVPNTLEVTSLNDRNGKTVAFQIDVSTQTISEQS